MEKAYEILKHIEDLYSKYDVTDNSVINSMKKKPEVVNAWREAFEPYDLNDVFKVIDEFWRYTNNRTRPKVAQLLSMLNTDKDVEKTKKQEKNESVRYSCIESELMSRDIALKRNSEFLLNDYRRAVDYILNNSLVNLIGEQEFRKLSNKDKTKERSDKYKIAMDNGLFNQFDDVLKFVKYGENDVCDNFTNI